MLCSLEIWIIIFASCITTLSDELIITFLFQFDAYFETWNENLVEFFSVTESKQMLLLSSTQIGMFIISAPFNQEDI